MGAPPMGRVVAVRRQRWRRNLSHQLLCGYEGSTVRTAAGTKEAVRVCVCSTINASLAVKGCSAYVSALETGTTEDPNASSERRRLGSNAIIVHQKKSTVMYVPWAAVLAYSVPRMYE